MNRADILELIPHAGPMCLLDEVLAWDATRIHCRSASHQNEKHPLRHGEKLAAVHLVEYGAQAAAVHGGLLAADRGEPALNAGRLAGLRDIEYSGSDIGRIKSTLDITANRELAGASGLIYRFVVRGDKTVLARGRLTVVGRSPTR